MENHNLQNIKDGVEIFHAIDQSALVLGPTHQILAANKATLVLLNKTAQEIVGRKCYELFHNPENPHPPEECPLRMLVEQGGTRTGSMAIEAVDKHFQITCTPIYEKDGKLNRIIHIAADITEKKRAEDDLRLAFTELKDLDRLKDDFLANVSHELRTPLVSIKGYAELILKKANGDKLADWALRIINGSTRLGRIVDDLLAIISLQKEKNKLRIEPCNPIELVSSSLNMLEPKISDKDIRVDIKDPDDLPKIQVDRTKIISVLLNLIENAIKFSDHGGEVAITVQLRENNSINFSITDDGIGIEEQYFKKIFNKFYQVDSSLTRKYDGSGIGLSLVKTIVEIHGGEIHVESKPGLGSTFCFYLPIDQPGVYQKN